MSAISNFLTFLRSAIYAIDVRDGIADAIEQCYNDVNNPTLKTEALEAALQTKIDEGEMAALTIGDGTITAAKLASGVIDNTLANSGAAADAKKTGDEIAAVKADLSDISEGGTLADINDVVIGRPWNLGQTPNRATIFIPVESSTQYTLSISSLSPFEGVYWIEKVNREDTTNVFDHQITTNVKSCVTTANTKWVVIQFNKTNIAASDFQGVILQFVKGDGTTQVSAIDRVARENVNSIAKDYIGKNLANLSNLQIGIAWSDASDPNRAVLYIPVDPSTEYTLSLDSISGFDGVFWFEKASRDATSLLVDHQLASTEETRTTTENSTYFVLQFNKTNITESDFDNINIRFIKTIVDGVARERISKISEDINLADINNVEIGKAWNGIDNVNRAVLYIPVEPSTEYTLSFDSISGFDGVYWFEKASKGATTLLVDHQLASAEETRTTTENSTYFVLQFNKTNVTRAELIGLNVWFVKKGEGQNLTAVDSVARKEINDIKEKGIGGIFIDYNDIPTIAITIDGRLPQSKEDGDVDAYVQYKGNGNVFSDYCTLKVQGQSSQNYPKKNYTIKLYTNSARTKKDKRVFRDWEKSSKYVMKANWVDHSHARNIVNARLWSQIMKSRTDFDSLPDTLKNSHLAIDGFPIKVFANGVYQGLYTWNIPKSGMYGLDDEINTNALMYGDDYHYTGALIWRAASDQDNQWSDETHDEKPAIIKTGWDRVLSFVYTSSDADFVSQFSNYFDKQSVIDQYIFIYAGCIVDNLAKNQTFFTYDANKWYGGMYDMDGTWGCPPYPPVKATWYDYNTAFQSGYTVSTDGRGATNYLYERVGNLFAEDIKTRYQELRQDVLSESNIDAEFDRFMGVIPPYLYAEDYATTTGDGAFIDIPLKDSNDAIQVRQFVKARLEYVDSMIIGQKNLANISKIEIGKAWNGIDNVNRAVLYIPVEPSTEYTLSFDSISGFDGVYWFEKASKGATTLLVDHQLASAEETRTTTENSTYFVAQFNKNNIVKSDFDNINMRFVKTTD